MSKRVLTTLLVRDEEFKIVYHQDMYCAINTKYLDEKGCLTQTLNGIQMRASKTMQECIAGIRMSVEVDYMMKQGLSLEEALKEYQIATA